MRLGQGAWPTPPDPGLYLVGHWPDYEAFTFNVPAIGGLRCLPINLKQHLEPRGPLRTLRRRRRQRHYATGLGNWLNQLAPGSVVLFQDNLRVLDMLEGLETTFCGGVLARDLMAADLHRHRLLAGLHRRGMRVWSFDPDDCERHGFTAYTQFVRQWSAPPVAGASTDLFFVGRDKGRGATFDRLRGLAGAAGLSVDFELPARGTPVTYRAYLERLQGCTVVVDLVQPGQTGLTMRPVEAMVYGKKLLSDSPGAVELASACPSQVLCIDALPSAEELAAFVARPAEPWPESLRSRHLVEHALSAVAADALRTPSVLHRP